MFAANGIGTPRLLLLSAHAGAPNGPANSSGLLGKRLMLHPNGEVTGIYDEAMDSWPGPAVHPLPGGLRTDSSRGFVGGAKRQVMPTGGSLRALSLHDRASLDEQWGEAIHDRMRETLGRSLQWGINSRDMPEEINTVDLDATLTDSNGIPAPRIRYRISENTRRFMDFNLDRAEDAHRAAGAAKVIRTGLWRDQPGHLLGTAKMGTNPATSVVNEWGIAHDVPKLAMREHTGAYSASLVARGVIAPNSASWARTTDTPASSGAEVTPRGWPENASPRTTPHRQPTTDCGGVKPESTDDLALVECRNEESAL